MDTEIFILYFAHSHFFLFNNFYFLLNAINSDLTSTNQPIRQPKHIVPDAGEPFLGPEEWFPSNHRQ